jgi:hypothetical protein
VLVLGKKKYNSINSEKCYCELLRKQGSKVKHANIKDTIPWAICFTGKKFLTHITSIPLIIDMHVFLNLDQNSENMLIKPVSALITS